MRRVSNEKLIDVDIKSCFCRERLRLSIDDMLAVSYWAQCVDKSQPFSLCFKSAIPRWLRARPHDVPIIRVLPQQSTDLVKCNLIAPHITWNWSTASRPFSLPCVTWCLRRSNGKEQLTYSHAPHHHRRPTGHNNHSSFGVALFIHVLLSLSIREWLLWVLVKNSPKKPTWNKFGPSGGTQHGQLLRFMSQLSKKAQNKHFIIKCYQITRVIDFERG